MSNLTLYMIGAVLVALAVGVGADRLGISTFWIVIVVLVILGAALMAGVSRTRCDAQWYMRTIIACFNCRCAEAPPA